jgi:hypothetical protein
MDQSTLRDSTKYPPGYGDFALQCTDNIVCYFPRHLLEYMSPVFKDMFSLAAEAIDSHHSGTQSSQPPLKLTESSAIIEALLEHIDPKSKRVLPMYPDIILGLLDAAQKYQISTITEWFTEQAGLQQINAPGGLISKPFTSLHPNLALECALRFDFPFIGQLALRELAGTSSSTIKLENRDLASRVYNHTCQLRDVRMQRYRRYISQLSLQFKASGHMSKPCTNCISLACQWILNMERAIVDSPRWDSFTTAYESAIECDLKQCYVSVWSSQLRQSTIGWSEEAKKAEDELPEWPF